MKYAIIYEDKLAEDYTYVLLGFTNDSKYLEKKDTIVGYKLVELRETDDLFIPLGSENTTYFNINL